MLTKLFQHFDLLPWSDPHSIIPLKSILSQKRGPKEICMWNFLVFFFFFFSIRPCLDDCPYWTSKFSVILWGFCIYSINNSINSKPVTNHLSWVEILQSKGNLLGVNVLGTVAIGGQPDIFCVKCNFLWRLELSTRQQASHISVLFRHGILPALQLSAKGPGLCWVLHYLWQPYALES